VRGLSIVNFEDNGIVLTGSGGNQISGNFIGLEPDGSTAAGNGSNALNIFGAGSNLIGGLTPAQRNIISGNGNGVLIRSSSGNVIQGNYIGTNAAGSASVFNDGDGLTIFSASADTLIGGTTPGARNVISGTTTTPFSSTEWARIGQSSGQLPWAGQHRTFRDPER
jgi:parallel beta-helix repeat protein